jgi:hypothetical protein
MNPPKPLSAEQRAAISARMMASHADPEFRAKHQAGLKAAYADPEVKAAAVARLAECRRLQVRDPAKTG